MHIDHRPKKGLFTCDVHHPRGQRAPLFSDTGVAALSQLWGRAVTPEADPSTLYPPEGMVTSLGTLCASNTHLLSFHITRNHLQLITNIKMLGSPLPDTLRKRKGEHTVKTPNSTFATQQGEV